MTNDIKLVASLQYIQNAIDNVELVDVDIFGYKEKDDLIYYLTNCIEILKKVV